MSDPHQSETASRSPSEDIPDDPSLPEPTTPLATPRPETPDSRSVTPVPRARLSTQEDVPTEEEVPEPHTPPLHPLETRDEPRRDSATPELLPPPSPGPPVAGKKRRTGAKQAFDNEKSVRFETSEWAPHLTPKKVPRQSKLIRTAIPPLELQQASSSSQHSLDTRKISAPSQSSPIVVPDRSRQMAAFQRRRRADTRSRGHRSSTPPQVQVVGQKPAQGDHGGSASAQQPQMAATLHGQPLPMQQQEYVPPMQQQQYAQPVQMQQQEYAPLMQQQYAQPVPMQQQYAQPLPVQQQQQYYIPVPQQYTQHAQAPPIYLAPAPVHPMPGHAMPPPRPSAMQASNSYYMIPQEPNDSWSMAHTPTNHPDSRQNGRSQKGKGKERAPSPLLDMDDPMSESDETDGLMDSDEVGMSTTEEELLEEQMGDDADDESDPGYDDLREADGRNFEANDDELAVEELIDDQAAEQEPEDIDGVDPREHSASHPQSSRSTQPGGPSQKQRARTQPTSRQFAVVLLDKMQQLNNSILEREERNREFQERMLDSVKALNRKVTEVQYAAPAIAKHQAKASAARRERPSRGMAARVVLEPQTSSAPMSPQEREKLLLREKRYLTKLQRVVRDHTKTLLRFTGKDYKTMVDNNPPLTDEEIEAYRASSQPSYFAQHRFRVDFTKPWGGFDFNVEARDWFVQHLLRAFQGGSYSRANIPARYRTAEHIGAALDTYIETCRDEYRRITKPPDQATMDRRKERVRRNSRKNTLYMSREDVLLKHDWTRHLELFAKLKPEFMSGDETDRDDDGRKLHPLSFTIVEPKWASIEYRAFLRKIDAWRFHDWKNPTVDGDYKGGNGPRVRNFKGKMVDSPAPKGLWRNCYNQAWVSKLKPHQLRSLSIVEEDYDFALPSEDEDSTEEEL